MGGSAPKAPDVTVPPPIPVVQSPASIAAGKAVQGRAQNAMGPSAMIDTGPNGLQAPATTSAKTLLGS
jgi:hypothetical protein